MGGISNTICFWVDVFLFVVCIMQITANGVVLWVWVRTKSLRSNENLIMLVSLAFIDFAYAVLQFPYLIILMDGRRPDEIPFDYSASLIYWIGGPSAALMKSGCTITSAVAADRCCALIFPAKYYRGNKFRWSVAAFVLALTLAFIDWLVMVIIVPVFPHPGCSAFGCFMTSAFRMWWGLSNMAMNFISCILTVVMIGAMWERKRRADLQRKIDKIENEYRNKIDKSANRVAFWILLVSAAIGVVPGALNGVSMFIEVDFLNELSFFVGTCATLSGLSHAFIFAMAHRGIRSAIHSTFGCSSVEAQGHTRQVASKSAASMMSRAN